MKKDECFELGYITKTHGLEGEVSAVFDVDIPEHYADIESVFIEIQNQLVPYFIEYIHSANNRLIVKFEEIDGVEQANPLKNKKLYLPLKALPELDEDQYYYHELIDYSIHDQGLGELGTVENVFDMGSQMLIAMIYKGKEVLIPIQDDIVKKVDKQQKVIETALPEGLLDLYMEE
ncbi:ribosome maturation factor RimM [Rapidithrix thailandica]|uniref:Ribosome maturation factor RimM n=1 Tax=Rapidithrix thailandica TaxID=413964 RepID=A0AAW9RXY8_9BACT